jgi:hypothetical protein
MTPSLFEARQPIWQVGLVLTFTTAAHNLQGIRNLPSAFFLFLGGVACPKL